MRVPNVLLSVVLGASAWACEASMPPVGGGPAAVATIVGRCVDGSGTPVADARVSWGRGPGVASDADGRFRLELSFDPHFAVFPARVALEKEGFRRVELDASAPAGGTRDLGEIVLE
jgi:hypothetical protein